MSGSIEVRQLVATLEVSQETTQVTVTTGAPGPRGPGSVTILGSHPEALADGEVDRILVPHAGTLTAAAGVLATGPTGTMTLTVSRGGSAIAVLTWAPGATTATVTGPPVAVAADDLLVVELAGSSGAAGLAYYLTGDAT